MVDQYDRDGFKWTIMRYNLPGNFGGLAKRAGKGCDGCRFFYDTLHDHLYRRWWYGPTPRIEPIAPETKVHIESRTGAVAQYDLGIENNSQRCTMDLKQASDLKFQPDFTFPINPSEEACWRTALGWLNTCITEHASCIASATAPILPKRIIDVLPEDEQTHARLILPVTNTTARFVALSHCWGSQEKNTGMVRLTSENQTTWQQNGIDVHSLPLNFRDAITVTRRLGIRYLWIDALCILQDSTADWVAAASKMADIFGTATLVLSATSAKHCDEGILQPRLSTCSPLLGPSKNWFLARPRRTFTTLELEINAGHLNSRGWAVQERMMAQRVLHYTPAGMIWECNAHLHSELLGVKAEENKKLIPNLVAAARRRNRQDDQSDPVPIPKATSSRFWPYPLPQRPANKKKKGGRLIKAGASTNSQGDTGTDAGVFLGEWFNCVTLCSSKDFTFPSDKLAAVAGLAAIFQDSLPHAGEYLAGVWSGYMATCLGWAKRVQYPSKLPSLSNQAFCAPSWSWAAGDGRIVWLQEEEDSTSSPRAPRSSTIQSALDDEARLVEHRIVPVDGDGPSHLVGAEEGSYIVLEANCIHPSDLSSIAAQCFYEPDWSEYAAGNPMPENHCFDGEFKFVQLGARSVDSKRHSRSGPYYEFWGLHLHRRSGPDSGFRRTGLLTCKIPYEVGRSSRIMATRAKEELYKSLPWKRERVKII